MSRFQKWGFVLTAVMVSILAFVAVAFAATWVLTESGAQDDINMQFVWSGTFTRDSASQHNVCLVFEDDALPPQSCADVNSANATPYFCAVPYAAVTEELNWEIVHAPNDNCTGYGTQDPPGDSGSISPTALGLASFSGQNANSVLPLALGLVAAAVVLASLLMLQQSRQAVHREDRHA